MLQAELIKSIAENTQESQVTVKNVLDSLVEHITQSLRKDGRQAVNGLGVFSCRTLAARTGRTPRTGDAVKVKASVRPAFRPSKAFRDTMPSPRAVAARAAKTAKK